MRLGFNAHKSDRDQGKLFPQNGVNGDPKSTGKIELFSKSVY